MSLEDLVTHHKEFSMADAFPALRLRSGTVSFIGNCCLFKSSLVGTVSVSRSMIFGKRKLEEAQLYAMDNLLKLLLEHYEIYEVNIS